MDLSPLIPRDAAFQSIRVVGVVEESWFGPSKFDHLLSKTGLPHNLSLCGINVCIVQSGTTHTVAARSRGNDTFPPLTELAVRGVATVNESPTLDS